jgi:tight adherence protein C
MAVVVLVAVFFGAGLMMIAIGFATRAAASLARQERLRRLTQSSESEDVSVPPARRLQLFGPVGRRLGEYLRARTEHGRLRNLQTRLRIAGRPLGMSAPDFLALKALLGVLATALFAYWLLISRFDIASLGPVVSALAAAVAAGLAAYYAPDLWLRRRVGARRDAIRRQLPQVCDLLSVCADAGASFDVALDRVVNSPYASGPLVDELADALEQARFGRARFDALVSMSDAVAVDELSGFVTAIGQSFKQGAAIADVLRVQASDIRRQARERAEGRAAIAPLKLLFPLVFLILPTLFLVIMTPALISTAGSLTGSP